VTFTVKTAKGSYADPSVFTEATETNAASYKLRNLMNQPSQCVVVLNDPNFASWQKYSALGADTYFGLYSRCKITDTELSPTTLFNGPVIRVIGQPREGTVELHCRDWLHQLDTRRVVYDTREDLDGSGLRESTAYRMDTAGPSMHGIIDSGANYRLYDTVAGWSENDWTGSTHYLLFSSKMAGTGNFWQAINAVTLTDCGNEAATDFSDSWTRGAPWEIEGDNANDDIDAVLDVACNIAGGSVTSVDLEFEYRADDGDETYVKLEVYESDTPGYQEIYLNETLPTSTSTFVQVSLTDIAGLINLANTDIIDTTNHRLRFKLTTDVQAGVKAYIWLHYFRVTINYADATVNTTAYVIDDDGNDYVEVSEDLPGARLDKHAPYSITQPVTAYVKDLVTTHDMVTTLDVTTDLVASTTTVLRHWDYATALKMLQDLALVDKTEFWLDEDLHLHWNDPYTTNGTTVTDADVLYWLNPTVGTDQGYANEIVITGQRTGTSQVLSVTDFEGGDIQHQYYGIHTLVKNSPGIYTQKDADAFNASLLARLEYPVVHVSYAVMGSGTGAKGWRDIGDVVKINSTDLGLTNKWYVVTETRFDSATGVQHVFLAPRATDGLVRQQMILDGTRWTRGAIEDTRRNMDHSAPHTETWS
jgi:hypothetical protein